MNGKDIEMERYLLKTDHDLHCEKVFEQRDKWLESVIEHTMAEHADVKERVSKLEILKDRMFWVILVATLGIIATNIIGPRLVPPQEGIKELTGYIAIVTEELRDQKTLIESKNKVSQENQTRLNQLEKLMKGKY